DTMAVVPSGSYSLHVFSTDTGCDTLLFFDVPEEEFQVSFYVSDTLICLGDTIRFTNTSDNHFTSFYWNMDNGDYYYSSGGPQDYKYLESGAYRVMLAGAGEICRDTAYRTITIDAPITPHFELNPRE